ncbi:MerR family transcriptional regulator [Kribbella sp. GL6]|uniref:MerR family transcriptional regulator n=1 Tax=Kribbella sp. GL6 TaxID=3419765 RepID=UPI003CFCEACE
MNTTELLDRRAAIAAYNPELEPVDPDLLCLLELPDDLPDDLSIAEAAELTGLTAHTLRYYERVGLVDVRRDAAGYRSYGRRAMSRIVFVSRLRASGMSIGAISHYLELVVEGEHTAPQRLALMQEHRERINRQLRELQLALAVTDYKIAAYGGTAAP